MQKFFFLTFSELKLPIKIFIKHLGVFPDNIKSFSKHKTSLCATCLFNTSMFSSIRLLESIDRMKHPVKTFALRRLLIHNIVSYLVLHNSLNSNYNKFNIELLASVNWLIHSVKHNGKCKSQGG